MARRKRPKQSPQRKKKIDVGKPGDLGKHGTPEEISEFLARRQATAKRRRQPKGTPGGGRFAPGGGQGKKVKYRPPGFKAEGRSGYSGARPKGEPRTSGAGGKGGRRPDLRRPNAPTQFGTRGAGNPTEQMSIHRAEARSSSRDQLERNVAYYKTRTLTGASTLAAPDDKDADIRVSHHDVRQAEMARKDQTWKTQKGVYKHAGAEKGKYIPPSRFIRDELPPSHVDEVNKAIQNPNSWLNKGLRPDQITDPGTQRRAQITLDSSGNPVIRGRLTPAQRNRLEQYTQGLQKGESHQTLASRFGTETRGRKKGTQTTVAGARTQDVKKSLDRKTRKGRKDKYKFSSPKAHEIRAGLNADHIDKISKLSDDFPNLSERDLIRLQQGQRETIWAQQLQRNARWAQETRANNATNNKLGASKDPNRVVFFTTSVGHPAPSVPSDSLIGQYIIRRRKNMLLKEGVVNARDVEGKFPAAVRDMHIIEAGTGVSFGAQGDVGAFQRTGFRVGTKKSPGYGKPIPVGSQILYDSQGRPLYDDQGNVRYSEGATRRFDVRTPDLGFRVFFG